MGKTCRYFEGWYFKQATSNGKALSLIPGIAFDEQGGGKSFIQILDGSAGESFFAEFPTDSFHASDRLLEISVGKSFFNSQGAHLDIDQPGISLQGDVSFGNFSSLPRTLFAPTVMGPYAYIPGMECCHGLISMDHALSGTITLNGRCYDFSGGNGYLEKDWGRSFPSSWVWSQSNSFAEGGTSLMFSAARIPWRKQFFTGFLCVFFHRGKFYKFMTYNGSSLDCLSVKGDNLNAQFTGGGYTLSVKGLICRSGLLKAPVNGSMSRAIAESLSSELEVKLISKDGEFIFDGTGFSAGIEAAGDLSEIERSR